MLNFVKDNSGISQVKEGYPTGNNCKTGVRRSQKNGFAFMGCCQKEQIT
jgi:hypothetical protein